MPKAGFTNSYVSFETGHNLRDLLAVKQEIRGWESDRRYIGTNALEDLLSGYSGFVLRDRRNGKAIGIVSYSIDNGYLIVEDIATSGAKRSSGMRLMLEVAKRASSQNSGVKLEALHSAERFYRSIGMEEYRDHHFRWTANSVNYFIDNFKQYLKR